MNAYEITLVSGATFRVSADAGVKIQQCIMGNGPHALEIDTEGGRSIFIATAHVESVEIVPEPDGEATQ